jgi:crotonobetainyl-CoA:carnitine CoA-transferase CaiB-like acyl-CoA transferase
MLSSAGVPSGKVRSLDDVYSWEQTQSQGLLVSVLHETLGSVDLPGSPIRFDDNPFSGGRSEHLAPPTLGQHDQSIRDWLDS